MQKTTRFPRFDKNAEEVMNFYASIFKDSRINVNRCHDEPLDGPMKGMKGKVLPARLSLKDSGLWRLTAAQ